MTTSAHLWAIGYDDEGRAAQVCDEITRLGWVEHYLYLLDVAVVVRHRDGSFAIEHNPFPGLGNILGCGTVGFLAGLVLAAPLTVGFAGALLGGAGTAAAANFGIDDEFIREIEELMKPGTSALFVLDDEGDMEIILHAIRGLGGSVLKTNVDMERVKLIQETLTAASPVQTEPGRDVDSM